MFSRIVVALNDPPESQRVLAAAIDLARSCNDELATVSILGDLPVHTSFSLVIDPEASAAMMEERRNHHKQLHEKAANLARQSGVHSQASIVVGNEVRAVLRILKEQNADSLVIGLHQHEVYQSRLWSSIYDLAQNVTCSVPGVH